MEFREGQRLFVRVDRKTGGETLSEEGLREHLAYVQSAAEGRFFLGGGTANADGGIIVMEAADLAEAEEIFQRDPLIKKGIYSCDVYEWELAVTSEK